MHNPDFFWQLARASAIYTELQVSFYVECFVKCFNFVQSIPDFFRLLKVVKNRGGETRARDAAAHTYIEMLCVFNVRIEAQSQEDIIASIIFFCTVSKCSVFAAVSRCTNNSVASADRQGFNYNSSIRQLISQFLNFYVHAVSFHGILLSHGGCLAFFHG